MQLPTFPEVPWLTEWHRVGAAARAQRDYVAQELARIAEAGAPVLTQVLTVPFEVQQILALSVLHTESPLAPDHRWYLRLVEGAKPPHKDAQGRDVMPEADRGKVLVAKTTTLGGRLHNSHALPGSMTVEYGGARTQARAHHGQDIYSYVRVGRQPVGVSLDDAVCLLRKWGYGIPMVREMNRHDPTRTQDTWLIEEVPADAADEILRDARIAAKTAKTAKPAAVASP